MCLHRSIPPRPISLIPLLLNFRIHVTKQNIHCPGYGASVSSNVTVVITDEDDEIPFGLDVVSDPHLLLLRSSLVAEFESRLRSLAEARASEFVLEFPDGLLAVIASHVLQEAETEPYGLKGKQIFLSKM